MPTCATIEEGYRTTVFYAHPELARLLTWQTCWCVKHQRKEAIWTLNDVMCGSALRRRPSARILFLDRFKITSFDVWTLSVQRNGQDCCRRLDGQGWICDRVCNVFLSNSTIDAIIGIYHHLYTLFCAHQCVFYCNFWMLRNLWIKQSWNPTGQILQQSRTTRSWINTGWKETKLPTNRCFCSSQCNYCACTTPITTLLVHLGQNALYKQVTKQTIFQQQIPGK